MVQQRMERFWQKQMHLDELTQLGWDDAADYFREGDEKYSTAELMVMPLFNCKRMMMLRHLHQQHLESVWSVMELSLEYR